MPKLTDIRHVLVGVSFAPVAILATCFTVSHALAGSCPTVEKLVFQPSGPHVRITALLQGKPCAGATVDLYPFPDDFRGRIRLRANDEGTVDFRDIRPGLYHAEAKKGWRLVGDLYFEVRSSAKQPASVFVVDLNPGLFSQAMQLKLEAAEKSLPTERVRELSGVLVDQTGASIPAARIDVWKQGSTDDLPFVETISGPDGRFAAHLVPGVYVVSFRPDGFENIVMVVEVGPGGDSQELKVRFRIAVTVC